MEDQPNVLYALRMSRRTTASVNIDSEIARNYKRMHEAEVHRGMTIDHGGRLEHHILFEPGRTLCWA
jgi:hypothetical protein